MCGGRVLQGHERHTAALVVAINAATIETGVEVGAPAGSAANGSQVAELSDVTCWSAGACVAVGSFKDAIGDKQALVTPITTGVPGTGMGGQLPRGRRDPGSSTVPDAELLKVSCSGTGSCAAVGDYITSANNVEGLVLIINGVPGHGGRRTAAVRRSDRQQHARRDAQRCELQRATNVLVAGDYLVSLSPIDQEPLVVPLADGAVGAGEYAAPGGCRQRQQQDSGVAVRQLPGHWNLYRRRLVHRLLR